MRFLKKSNSKSQSLSCKIHAAVEKNLPVGYSVKRELVGSINCIIVASVLSLSYILRYWQAYDALFVHSLDGTRTNRIAEGAVMVDFAELVGNSLSGFPIAALICLIIHTVEHYIYHRSGGAYSYYTMRRLPDRYEYIRRCLLLPTIEAVLILAVGAAVLGIDYMTYLQMTPSICLGTGK